MATTILFDRPLILEKTNFKGEHYPDNVMEYVGTYLEIIDAQLGIKAGDDSPLRPHHPLLIRKYIDFDNGNTINRKEFEHTFSFNSYHPRSKSVSEKEENNEIKGLYVFADVKDDGIQVMNVGISRTILRRFYQHTCGLLHNQSTLGFHMAVQEHKTHGLVHVGKREHFPYERYRDQFAEVIRNFRFAIVPIENNFTLHMAEVYIACHYRSYWNTFKTH